jgi:oligopeptide transport system permease protein
MLKYLARRLLTLIPVWLGIILVTFLIVHSVPGGPFSTGAIRSHAATAVLLRFYHLNEPIWKQFAYYISKVVQGELGTSIVHPGLSIGSVISSRFPVSALLGACGLAIALAVGLPAGVFAAARQDSWLDRTLVLSATIGYAIPNFVLSILLVLIFGAGLHLLPLGGWGGIDHLILPAVALGLPWAGLIARMTRATMIEALREDYVKVAVAKGAGPRRVLIAHALRNALLPLSTIFAVMAAEMITGSLVVEQIFSVPGIGHYMVESILGSDYTMTLGLVTFYATVVFLANLLADISYAWLDPRIRYGGN